jgi:hypothetical protein
MYIHHRYICKQIFKSNDDMYTILHFRSLEEVQADPRFAASIDCNFPDHKLQLKIQALKFRSYLKLNVKVHFYLKCWNVFHL